MQLELLQINHGATMCVLMHVKAFCFGTHLRASEYVAIISYSIYLVP